MTSSRTFLSLVGSAAAQPAVACGKGEHLYRDNFSWIDASWQLTPKLSAIESGTLTFRLGPKQDAQVNNESGYYGDANVCFDVNFESGSLEASLASFLFWYANRDAHLLVLLNGQIGLARTVANEYLWPAALRPVKNFRSGRGDWNTVEVQTRDKNVRLLVNGVQAFAVNGVPPANGGKLALGALNTGGGSVVVKFRNFVVERGLGSGLSGTGR